MNDGISILNVSLMNEPTPNGYQLSMKKVFTGGYYELLNSDPELNVKIVREVFDKKPSIVFLQLQCENVIHPSTLEEIRKHTFIIEYCGDVRQTLPWHYYTTGRLIHLSTFSNMRDVYTLREAGMKADWLECGFDPERFKSWHDPLPAPKIVAHMNCYGDGYFPLSTYRRQIVDRLTKEFGDLFGVYGNFPPYHKGNFNYDQIQESKNYAGAQIAINCSHFAIQKYSSDRLSRITGTGGATCLSHFFPDMEALYKVGEHWDVFHDIDELLRKCKFYLERPELCKQMAAAAQKHALENYTFECMAKNIKRLYLQYR